MAECQARGWTVDASRPGTNNPDTQSVAHIHDATGEMIGLGMSSESTWLAIIDAFRAAWAWRYPQSQLDSST
jgi:hypothetical protein